VTLDILLTQGALVAVNKPPGLLVIPGRSDVPEACVRDLLAAQLGKEVWVCHRIDRDTSGVLLFATDAKIHRTVSMAFEGGNVSKRYLALVQGKVRGPLDIELALVEARKRKMRIALPGELGKASRTLVRPLELFEKSSLVECEPLSGRQHQLRVHLRAKGHPLLIDHQYGRKDPLLARELGVETDEVLLDRTPLHARSLAIPELKFFVEAPLPADLRRTLEALREVAARTKPT
jgi:tRNA pseudouridine32 synthase/23S rRNA pseudouridine746 synthase/23S rRNA pseudouridine955/2504/2580 synthase